ncbi:MAG: hypothetical protein JXR75_02000 [Rhodobacteraceae bacterium]|nr:hypothetical protein [Paracoccaceae bacterium]
MQTSRAQAFDRLHQAFDGEKAMFASLGRTALDAAFRDADTKTRIAKILEG